MMPDCKGFFSNCSETSWQCAKSNFKDLTPSPLDPIAFVQWIICIAITDSMRSR